MRVTGGELGGRSLRAPRGQGVRPTADRVRESMFAALGEIAGARVFDGFAGTGALGIEALSRGARSAVFAERSARVLAVLRDNLETLGLLGRSRVQRGDVARVLRRCADSESDASELPVCGPFDCVFFDPPYQNGQGDARRALEALDACALLARGGRVVLESSRHHPPEIPPGFLQVAERRYGDTVVVYLSSLEKPPGGGGARRGRASAKN